MNDEGPLTACIIFCFIAAVSIAFELSKGMSSINMLYHKRSQSKSMGARAKAITPKTTQNNAQATTKKLKKTLETRDYMRMLVKRVIWYPIVPILSKLLILL